MPQKKTMTSKKVERKVADEEDVRPIAKTAKRRTRGTKRAAAREGRAPTTRTPARPTKTVEAPRKGKASAKKRATGRKTSRGD